MTITHLNITNKNIINTNYSDFNSFQSRYLTFSLWNNNTAPEGSMTWNSHNFLKFE